MFFHAVILQQHLIIVFICFFFVVNLMYFVFIFLGNAEATFCPTNQPQAEFARRPAGEWLLGPVSTAEEGRVQGVYTGRLSQVKE